MSSEKTLKKIITSTDSLLNKSLLKGFSGLFKSLREAKKTTFNRCLPLPELFTDRWEKAKFLQFGEGSSIYDSATVIADVEVGANTWIGPNVILDGSGGLVIGSNCSISANVQIYSHDTVKWAVSGGKESYEYAPTTIGDNCYIGPNVVIQRGITIGEGTVVGANSFVNVDLPAGCKAVGSPVRIL